MNDASSVLGSNRCISLWQFSFMLRNNQRDVSCDLSKWEKKVHKRVEEVNKSQVILVHFFYERDQWFFHRSNGFRANDDGWIKKSISVRFSTLHNWKKFQWNKKSSHTDVFLLPLKGARLRQVGAYKSLCRERWIFQFRDFYCILCERKRTKESGRKS